MTLREGGPLPHNDRRPRSGRVSDRFPDPEIIPGDHIPTGTTKLNRVNNFQNLEACRGEETTDVACREPLSHPKQGRTPTRMVQSKVTAITTQTAAGHEVPPEVPRQSKKRRVFVQCF
jgi:hypothetical protein